MAPPTKNTESELVLMNIAEELVKRRVLELMETMDVCRCERCYLDACAIALNSLGPRYVTTDKGSLMSKLGTTDIPYQAQLTVCATQAIMKVREHPHHS
ncbi:MAG TPA: late competence development ComFB family protein [Terriglobales bacterium]|nr:late competence development ComFB family protein [Terriglobales bacterium]